MPTFIIFKNGRENKRIKGADPKALDSAIKSLANEAAASASASSADAASSSPPGLPAGGVWLGASLPRGYGDITENVDQLNLDFLNVDSDAGNARSVFTNTAPSSLSKAQKTDDTKDWIESDTDEQLMLYIPFQATLKVHSLHITSIPTSDDDDDVSRPSSVRLYTNKSNVISFDEAEDLPATQTIELKPEDWDPNTHTAKLDLRFVKFQNITSLVVFVAESEGDGEKTRIDRIRIVGETGEKRSMGKLEKIGDEQGE